MCWWCFASITHCICGCNKMLMTHSNISTFFSFWSKIWDSSKWFSSRHRVLISSNQDFHNYCMPHSYFKAVQIKNIHFPVCTVCIYLTSWWVLDLVWQVNTFDWCFILASLFRKIWIKILHGKQCWQDLFSACPWVLFRLHTVLTT